jgi:hypothetical protein
VKVLDLSEAKPYGLAWPDGNKITFPAYERGFTAMVAGQNITSPFED